MENSSVSPFFKFNADVLPRPYHLKDVGVGLQKWEESAHELAQNPENAALSGWMQDAGKPAHPAHAVMAMLFGNSPYLSRLLLLYPDVLFDITSAGLAPTWEKLLGGLDAPPEGSDSKALMRHLRIIKGKAALLIAIADLSGQWALEQVTGALSTLAERCLALALNNLLLAAHSSGEIELSNPQAPSVNSGIIVLGMGKLGGRELNYSSDIDLIVLFEPGKILYKGRLSEQKFMNRLCHELVAIMQERTPNGYVFRTDLRLRPDPASTPPAITVDAAYTYYEGVGQNWERAAMIKARPVAGDMLAGERFLKGLTPFMWRRNLDFAAIADIHSIKRQMDSYRNQQIRIKGHNIKLGQGGIREIEFFAQIHQLIWGGREPVLRSRATCETLASLAEYGLIDEQKKTLLENAYASLRKLEHRLQMVDDEQTHSLPDNDDAIAHIACFMGYDMPAPFQQELMTLLAQVHDIYASSFKSDNEQLLGDEGNLVFTGASHDPDTLETLRRMGFSNPETISEIVMGWHHGSRKATRTKRARELLTEMMPMLLKRLGETAHPDTAFLKFNEFLTNLPSGVQLFSLFNANLHLLELVADIMGSAPTLADKLSKTPELLDAVLYADFYAALPPESVMSVQIDQTLKDVDDAEIAIERIRYFRNEKQFQAGVQLLKGMITAQTVGVFLSRLADITLQKTFDAIEREFSRTYGKLEGGHFAIMALGKLGSLELTFGSDIDLIFVYDAPDPDRFSSGEKAISASVYFNRLAQRFVGALTAMGRNGRLYEVDTRLRPSGAKGMLAVSVAALSQYFDELAWTFEYMALTKARIVIGSPAIRDQLEDFIHRQLVRPRDPVKLKADAADMRERIEKKYATTNPWDIKYARGGMMDLDFLAQYLLLLHAPATPGSKPGSATEIFDWLQHCGRIAPDTARQLMEASQFLTSIFHMLRLCTEGDFDETTALQGLTKLLMESVGEKDFESAKARLIHVEQTVFQHYIGSLTV